jgi:hypothetical protein
MRAAARRAGGRLPGVHTAEGTTPVDEAFALASPWDDVDLAAVQTSVTWWHAPKDANAPLSAARRVVGHLPNARLITFSENEGHLAGYHRQGEILDELLARG